MILGRSGEVGEDESRWREERGFPRRCPSVPDFLFPDTSSFSGFTFLLLIRCWNFRSSRQIVEMYAPNIYVFVAIVLLDPHFSVRARGPPVLPVGNEISTGAVAVAPLQPSSSAAPSPSTLMSSTAADPLREASAGPPTPTLPETVVQAANSTPTASSSLTEDAKRARMWVSRFSDFSEVLSVSDDARSENVSARSPVPTSDGVAVDDSVDLTNSTHLVSSPGVVGVQFTDDESGLSPNDAPYSSSLSNEEILEGQWEKHFCKALPKGHDSQWSVNFGYMRSGYDIFQLDPAGKDILFPFKSTIFRDRCRSSGYMSPDLSAIGPSPFCDNRSHTLTVSNSQELDRVFSQIVKFDDGSSLHSNFAAAGVTGGISHVRELAREDASESANLTSLYLNGQFFIHNRMCRAWTVSYLEGYRPSFDAGFITQAFKLEHCARTAKTELESIRCVRRFISIYGTYLRLCIWFAYTPVVTSVLSFSFYTGTHYVKAADMGIRSVYHLSTKGSFLEGRHKNSR